MIKNIILDVGGILFDDSKRNIENVLNKNCDSIYQKAYGTEFKECLLGYKTVQEHVIKPNPIIYNLLIDKFKLNKEETIFFDDKEKNVIAAHNVGIKGIVFNSIADIENNL